VGGAATRNLDNVDTATHSININFGTDHFEPDARLIVHIRDVADPLVIAPDKRVIFGRTSFGSARCPDIDLTPYGALEKGVSHIHAAIIRSGDHLLVVDAGSANGTYLNGQRLTTKREHILCDGDEIRLGNLVAHIYFQTA
jgi:pSer/pThr/pTyr-binding forkhead associated (FHA) protein